MDKIPESTKVKCPWDDCHYEWTTLSQKKVVTCPGCTRKVETKIHIDIKDSKWKDKKEKKE